MVLKEPRRQYGVSGNVKICKNLMGGMKVVEGEGNDMERIGELTQKQYYAGRWEKTPIQTCSNRFCKC